MQSSWKKKAVFFSVSAIELHKGSSGSAPHIPNRGRWVVNFATQSLHHQEESQYLLNRKLGVLQTRAESFGKEKNFLLLPGLKPRTIQPVI